MELSALDSGVPPGAGSTWLVLWVILIAVGVLGASWFFCNGKLAR